MPWISGNPVTNPAANAVLVTLGPMPDGGPVSVSLLITFRGPAGFDAILEYRDGAGTVLASHLLPIGLSPWVLPLVGPINLPRDHSLRVKNRNQVTGEAQASIFWKEGAP